MTYVWHSGETDRVTNDNHLYNKLPSLEAKCLSIA
jgi:hypothetical protein